MADECDACQAFLAYIREEDGDLQTPFPAEGDEEVLVRHHHEQEAALKSRLLAAERLIIEGDRLFKVDPSDPATRFAWLKFGAALAEARAALQSLSAREQAEQYGPKSVGSQAPTTTLSGLRSADKVEPASKRADPRAAKEGRA
jgi:hypothetical protein